MIIRRIAVLLTLFTLLAACQSVTETMHGISLSAIPRSTNHYTTPAAGNDIVGHSFAIRSKRGDNLSEIGQRFDVGISEMMSANPKIKPYKMLPGTNVIIPAQYILQPQKYRKGIVINVPEMRLYYFAADGTISTYPVALGREKWRTPLGKTYVVRKQESPTWHVPASIQAEARKNGRELPDSIPPGPRNPLGPYAIYLGMPGYLIHGTTSPNSIGRLVSSGCIRMFNKDVTDLYSRVKKGDPVSIIYYPNKVGWRGNKLYLESHKPITDEEGTYKDIPIDTAIADAAKTKPDTQVDWDKIKQISGKHAGAPIAVGHA